MGDFFEDLREAFKKMLDIQRVTMNKVAELEKRIEKLESD